MSRSELTEDLFQQVLINPALQPKVARLQIVSGFATASMADRHMEQLSDLKAKVSIELIVGMTKQCGIERAQHMAFCQLAERGAYGLDFSCRYVVNNKPVHAKAYLWSTNRGSPVVAFSGSANYTQRAFGNAQTENMVSTACSSVRTLYEAVMRDTVDCLEKKAVSRYLIPTETRRIRGIPRTKEIPDETVALSLLTRTGKIHEKAGLNWGQRKGRDKNQAYIPVPSNIVKKKFFPPRGEPFIVMTDDEDSFIFVVAQDGDKALHTKESNALLGEYIRTRMGLQSGQRVTLEHLKKYGRTNVSFTKIDDETYLMDFSS